VPGPASTYYLQGGPCDGKTGQLSPAQEQSQQVICKNSVYKEDATDNTRRPDIVFRYAGKVPAPGGGVKAPHVHTGYAAIQHVTNKKWDPAIVNSRKYAQAALRKLAKARRVGA